MVAKAVATYNDNGPMRTISPTKSCRQLETNVESVLRERGGHMAVHLLIYRAYHERHSRHVPWLADEYHPMARVRLGWQSLYGCSGIAFRQLPIRIPIRTRDNQPHIRMSE